MSLASVRRGFFAALGLLVLIALWQWAFVEGGPFVMPAPLDAFARMLGIIRGGAVWQPAGVTAFHALLGFGIGSAIGIAFGFAGGLIEDLGVAVGTISTVILGIPPIIWIVLALLWFGPQGIVPTFTVAVGIAPVVFAGAIAGTRSSRADLDELAAAFGSPWRQHFFEIRVPQISIALMPALATALGFAWKIALMAEVLDVGSGIGGQIADARSHLDTVETMAWVVIAVVLLLIADVALAQALGARRAGLNNVP